MDVKFTQSTDGGSTWSAPVTMNDNVDAAGVPTDQFQPSVAAGPAGAVAVAFYDRRLPCPRVLSVLRGSAGPRVRAGGGLLYIAQWHPGIKTGRER
jgi:hypothetical protein